MRVAATLATALPLLLMASACATPSVDGVAPTSTAPSPPPEATVAVVSEAPAISESTTTTAPQAEDSVTKSVTGVVVAVDGGLAEVDSFSIVLDDGSTLVLTPERGLLFDHASPLSHVRDHMISGTPVLVEFHAAGDDLVATAVGDAE